MIAELTQAAAVLVATGGVLAGVVVVASTGNVRLALAVLLELLTAAGLLRLAEAVTLMPVLGAAGIILIRRIATAGLHSSPPAPYGTATER